MARRLLDRDPETGVSTFHHYDHDSRTTFIETVQDVAPYLEANKARTNMDTATSGRLNSVSRQQIKDGWWHVACVPIGVQYRWLKDHGVNVFNKDHMPRVKKLLNDPEWRYLRTTPGRV